MNNEGFISSKHVFDLLIRDLIKPRKFNCVTAVSRGFICPTAENRGIYQIRSGICQILPRKTVGPTDQQYLVINCQPLHEVQDDDDDNDDGDNDDDDDDDEDDEDDECGIPKGGVKRRSGPISRIPGGDRKVVTVGVVQMEKVNDQMGQGRSV